MTKSINELKEVRDGLFDLKLQSEKAISEDMSKRLKKQVFDGAMALLSTSGEFSPALTRSNADGLNEQLAHWKQEIKWPAESLRDWAIGKR